MNHDNSIDWQVKLWKEFDATDPAVLDQNGRQLILDIEAAWDRGEKEFVIPPGCYRTPTPLPLIEGGSLQGNRDAMVRAPSPGWVMYPYRNEAPNDQFAQAHTIENFRFPEQP
jgi:hypothetical protein